MASGTGTTILQDDGSVTLDEDGLELLSDGASDCDCCGVTPNCCTIGTCCFDTANGRFVGHVYIRARFYSGAGATGSLLATVIFEADFSIPEDFEGSCGQSATALGYVPGVGEYFSNIIFTQNGVDLTQDPVCQLALWMNGDGTWNVLTSLFGQNIYTIPNDPASVVLSSEPYSIGPGFVYNLSTPGDCLTLTPLSFDFVEAHTYADSSIGSVRIDSTLTADIENSYCCKTEGVCGPSLVPATDGDGTCS